MRSGKLRQFVEVQEPDLVADDRGGEKAQPATNPGSDGSGWKRRGDTWVGIDTMSSREILSEGRIGLGVTHMVRARDTGKIDQTCRLKMLAPTRNGSGSAADRFLYVIGVQHVEERCRELLLTCEERK